MIFHAKEEGRIKYAIVYSSNGFFKAVLLGQLGFYDNHRESQMMEGNGLVICVVR